MKKVYVNEEWCLGCHLCEYQCAFANSGIDNMVKALKGKEIHPEFVLRETTASALRSTAATARTLFV